MRRSPGRLRRELRECVGSVIALAGIAFRTSTCDLDDQMQRCLCALLAAALRTDGQDDDEERWCCVCWEVAPQVCDPLIRCMRRLSHLCGLCQPRI